MNPIVIFTDGAARQNPGPGGWGAIIVTPQQEVVEIGGATAHTTNNKMEMMAVIEALAYIQNIPGEVTLHTDSSYLIHGITQWIRGWRRKGWMTAAGQPVLNQDLWERMDRLVQGRGKQGAIRWQHVRGHAGIPGNERCDEIATRMADGEPVDLYRGPLAKYDVDLNAVAARPAAQPTRSKTSTRAGASRPAYSYLSLVGGTLMRHASWAECEQRVRGVSGAKFKKAVNRADEEAIARAWGCAPLG